MWSQKRQVSRTKTADLVLYRSRTRQPLEALYEPHRVTPFMHESVNTAFRYMAQLICKAKAWANNRNGWLNTTCRNHKYRRLTCVLHL